MRPAAVFASSLLAFAAPVSLEVAPTLPTLSSAPPAQDISFETIEVAKGVYAFRPSELGVGNVVAILTETGVVVVDATLTPAGAEVIVGEIRRLTDQPVSTVITTHWHDDHFWGNQAFRDAFPGVRFVAHVNTRRDIIGRTIPGLEENRRAVAAAVETREVMLERGADEDGNPLSPEERATLEARLEMFRALGDGMVATEPVPPTEVFADQLTLHVGGLDIHLLYLGAGHTEGDVIVHVPARGVVIVGDLVTHPIPVVGEFMLEMPETLAQLAALQFDVLVPGHGQVLRDRDHLGLVIEVADALLRQVRLAVGGGLSLEEAADFVDLGDLETRLFGDDATTRRGFRRFFLTPAIEAAYSAMISGAK